mmetsp:Transcript_22802/g.36984  ORF Transcript_22802/g.36984 Transcript_22802/m.36984 type:complete len:214 (+) Transcript_22802:201-842(+)
MFLSSSSSPSSWYLTLSGTILVVFLRFGFGHIDLDFVGRSTVAFKIGRFLILGIIIAIAIGGNHRIFAWYVDLRLPQNCRRRFNFYSKSQKRDTARRQVHTVQHAERQSGLHPSFENNIRSQELAIVQDGLGRHITIELHTRPDAPRTVLLSIPLQLHRPSQMIANQGGTIFENVPNGPIKGENLTQVQRPLRQRIASCMRLFESQPQGRCRF